MKNRYLLSLATLLVLNLVTPFQMAATGQNNAQHVVAEIFKQHTDNQVRLQLLHALLANSFHTQDHNWFQQARNMTPEEELVLAQEYAASQHEQEKYALPIRQAIKFLEDKLAFEGRQREAQERLAWEADKDQRKKDELIFAGGCLAVVGLMALAIPHMTF